MRAILILSLAALTAPLFPQAPPRDLPGRPPASATATVSGRVYAAASGAPLQGALVVLLRVSGTESVRLPAPPPRGDGALPGAVADASGRFRITGVAPGDYRLVANPPAYGGRYLAAGHGAVRGNDPGKRITLSAGADIRNADIALPLGLAIEGRVTEASGEPLARMTVVAARIALGTDAAQRVPHAAAVTDDLGRYRIYQLEPGTYLVAATGRLGIPAFEAVDAQGYLGSPMQWDAEPFVTTYHPSARTDTLAQTVSLGTQDVTGIDISVQRASRFKVSGVILDSQGNPAVSTSLGLVRPGPITASPLAPGPPNMAFRTSPQGAFVLPPLEPGDYRILIGGSLAPGLTSVNGRTEFADVPISVAGDMTGLTIVTQPGIGLAGRIVFAEGAPSPMPPMRIVFRRPDPPRDAERFPDRNSEIVATFGDEQRFFGSDIFGPLLVRAPSLPAGWILKAVTLGGVDITDVPTAFRRDHDGQLEVVLTSRPSALEGEVRGESGRPSGEVAIFVFSEDRRGWTMSSPRTVLTEMREPGRFSVEGLSGGRYYAIAVARDGLRMPTRPGAPFFELLSREATPFVIGDDERRTLDLRLWRWPE